LKYIMIFFWLEMNVRGKHTVLHLRSTIKISERAPLISEREADVPPEGSLHFHNIKKARPKGFYVLTAISIKRLSIKGLEHMGCVTEIG